ncbi:hypothetical protein F5Y09DRAFT_336768 [Xylaria sp. FL1042]|nr:hypothetical protein F5Y09DRAFT_336675 [Xylaria sp. FL1042]KAI0435393.1 hypothetical protein F5Y09DRAFT_336768 [Xylaria sp. FL1042]
MSTLQPPNFHAVWDRHHRPSSSSPSPPHFQNPPPQQLRDVSSLHPVFFTGRLQRSPLIPNAVAPTPVPSLLHPVAHGYVYRDERLMRRPGGPMLGIACLPTDSKINLVISYNFNIHGLRAQMKHASALAQIHDYKPTIAKEPPESMTLTG